MSAEASFGEGPVPDDIRDLAVSYAGDTCLMADLDDQVWAISVKTRSILSSFPCLMDIGRHRLAVSEDGRFCGVAAFSISALQFPLAISSTWQSDVISSDPLHPKPARAQLNGIGCESRTVPVSASSMSRLCAPVDPYAQRNPHNTSSSGR